MGYTTGTIINNTSDIITTTGKSALDVANNSVHDINNIIIDKSMPGLDYSLNTKTTRNPNYNDVSPSPPNMSIQLPISSSKTNWCLIGDFQGRQGCVEVENSNMCMSKQLFASKDLCMNPNLTQNMNNSQEQQQPLPTLPMYPNQTNELIIPRPSFIV